MTQNVVRVERGANVFLTTSLGLPETIALGVDDGDKVALVGGVLDETSSTSFLLGRDDTTDSRDCSYSCTNVGDRVVTAIEEGERVKIFKSFGIIVIDGNFVARKVLGTSDGLEDGGIGVSKVMKLEVIEAP